MLSVRKSAVVLLLCLLLFSVSNGEERPTFRERAMQVARRISKYQEQLVEFTKTVQNVNFVSMVILINKFFKIMVEKKFFKEQRINYVLLVNG